MGRIPETEIYSAFVRMYNRLKCNEDIVLKPALAQLADLNAALQQDNPAMLAVNKAIADASEQSYKVTILQTRGLLDADACTAKLQAIHAQITELRRERRRLLQNEDLEDVMEALRQTAESQTRIRFRLHGGIELTECLREVTR